jgi:hypothetical protein
MQLLTMFGQMIESGEIILSTKDKEDVVIVATNKRIDIHAKNKEFVKYILASIREGGKSIGAVESKKESSKKLKTAKSARRLLINSAENLKLAGVTITLSYKGDVVATAGAQASSKLSRIMTGTKAIEINNLPKLLELGSNTL